MPCPIQMPGIITLNALVMNVRVESSAEMMLCRSILISRLTIRLPRAPPTGPQLASSTADSLGSSGRSRWEDSRVPSLGTKSVAEFPVLPGHFPWATFAINTSGAFVLGLLLAAILERWRAPWYLRPLTCVGFLGAWTTMSTLAFEADLLTKDGHGGTAIPYVFTTLVAGLAATACGVAIGRSRGATK